MPAAAFAQLKQYGPGREPGVKTPALKTARLKAASLNLPFWDDFSSVTDQQADPLKWIVNGQVFVNNGQAINPPSINVATFDGYNQNGMPYSTDPLKSGAGDSLESQPIDLDVVDAMYRNSIYLSFTYQAGGNSEMPDPDDYLKLEFKSKDHGWIEMARYRVTPSTEHDKFYDVVVQIVPTDPLDQAVPYFFHPDFQFKFKSFGRLSGQYDSWHLDYVYLNMRVADDPITTQINEFDVNTNISDRTTTKPFTSILPNGYYSMPVSHFNPGAMLAPHVSMYSLKHVTFTQVVSYTSNYTITNYTGSTPALSYNGSPDGGETSFNPSGFEIPVLQHATAQTKAIPNQAAYFNQNADSTKVNVEITINGGDNDPLKDYYLRYTGINFRSNDKLEHTFTLSNYYAYDDGVAEYSAGLAAQGNQLAYRFVMDNSLGSKTLNGIDIYLPYTGSSVPQNIRIYVFKDKAGKPDSLFAYSQYVPVNRTSNNVFYRIMFTEDVVVNGNFYIGYMETVTDKPDRIRVGLDASHDTGEHLYYRNSVYHKWQQNDEVHGSLMIRPLFGTVIPDPITGVENPGKPVSIYPNPNRGEFYMKGSSENIQIITITGQAVTFTTENLEDSKRITLHRAAPGLYIVRYRSGSNVFTDKILVKGY